MLTWPRWRSPSISVNQCWTSHPRRQPRANDQDDGHSWAVGGKWERDRVDILFNVAEGPAENPDMMKSILFDSN